MKQLKISLLMLLVFTVLCGAAYPLLVTGTGMVFFPYRSGGSLITENGSVMGSALIGQNFTVMRYFHGRPSAVNYDPSLSGGSNLGPSNKKLAESVRERGISLPSVHVLIEACSERQLPFYGMSYVNVLRLNMALDSAGAGR